MRVILIFIYYNIYGLPYLKKIQFKVTKIKIKTHESPLEYTSDINNFP